MIRTRLTEAYNIAHPVVSAGMAFVATAPLVRAVSAAGGLGVLGASGMPAELLRETLRGLRDAGPFGVNIIPRFNGIEHIELCAEEAVAAVVFFWDDVPKEWIERLHSGGSKVWIQVGSVAEAKRAVRAAADALIVQGSEAGGHNRADAATLALLPAVIDAIEGAVPVLAAGGIADGRGLAAALALGADGVSLGTRFLATPEAFAHEEYKRRLIAAGVQETARHNVFGHDFPDATVRGLKNRLVSEWLGRDEPAPYKTEPPGGHPVIGEMSVFGHAIPMKRFTGLPPTAEFSGDLEEMSLLAGESVGLIDRIAPAGEIVRTMAQEAEAIIADRLPRLVQKS
jgi:NAD(P)H-dependent flavin oxidoreductase YrpB (nitropropane dioxygenase family)